MKAPKSQSIDEYILAAPKEDQRLLTAMRSTIAKANPGVTEKIRYQMPTFYQNGNLVYFAAFKNHIGFFPTASGVREFEDELTAYKHSKGAIQFPKDKPLPLKLVKKMVEFRVKENSKKAV